MPVLVDSGPPSTPRVRPPEKPCHNCRRARLRCDRSLPCCEKCHARGESCLGYGQLFRWADVGAVTIRGRLAGKTPQQQVSCDENGLEKHGQTVVIGLPAVPSCLVDPLLQALSPRHRMYIRHCKSKRLTEIINSKFHTTTTNLLGHPTRRQVGLSRSRLLRPIRLHQPLPLHDLAPGRL